MTNQNVYVYSYAVYYIPDYADLSMLRLQRVFFALKRDAQYFARKHKKDNNFFKPIIIRTIRSRDYFKKDISVEVVANHKELETYFSVFDKYKRIKY